MAKRKKGKKKQGFPLPLLLVLLLVMAGVGAWLGTLPREERADAINWVRDVAEWIADGAKGEFPQRVRFVAVDAELADEYLFAGLPTPEDGLRLLPKRGFLIAYDENRKNPAWVAYKITPAASYPSTERPQRFSPDHKTRARVDHNDYSGTGYDRGHMAPNYVIATRYGREAQEDTFLMSNIVPQTPELNQGPWRELEEAFANRSSRRFDAIYVITGPIYDDHIERLRSGVEIPDQFFKIAAGIKGGSASLIAFIADQNVPRDLDPAVWLTTVDEVERLTGFDFFSALPDEEEDRLEAEARRSLW